MTVPASSKLIEKGMDVQIQGCLREVVTPYQDRRVFPRDSDDSQFRKGDHYLGTVTHIQRIRVNSIQVGPKM